MTSIIYKFKESHKAQKIPGRDRKRKISKTGKKTSETRIGRPQNNSQDTSE